MTVSHVRTTRFLNFFQVSDQFLNFINGNQPLITLGGGSSSNSSPVQINRTPLPLFNSNFMRHASSASATTSQTNRRTDSIVDVLVGGQIPRSDAVNVLPDSTTTDYNNGQEKQPKTTF